MVADRDVGENARFNLHLRDARGGAIPTGEKGPIFDVFPKEAMGSTPVIVKVMDAAALDFEDPNANSFAFQS